MNKKAFLCALACLIPTVCFAHPNQWIIENGRGVNLLSGGERMTISVCVDKIQGLDGRITVEGRITNSVNNISLKPGMCGAVWGSTIRVRPPRSGMTGSASGTFEFVK